MSTTGASVVLCEQPAFPLAPKQQILDIFGYI